MEEPEELRCNSHWRTAVWSLRVGFLGLAVALSGLLVLWAGSTPWVLGAGVIVWVAAAVITSTEFLWARHDLPEPRPGYWSMRLMILRDTVTRRLPRRAG